MKISESLNATIHFNFKVEASRHPFKVKGLKVTHTYPSRLLLLHKIA